MAKVIIKTNLYQVPNTCRECKYHIFMYGNLGCTILREWIEPYEYKEGKTKLKDCPLVEEK